MSLSHDVLIQTLNRQFVCGFRNIKDEPYSGKSGKHDPDTPAVLTTNGAGPHNVQIFILNSDGVVMRTRSQLQGFDEKKERRKGDADFKVQAGQQPSLTLTKRGLKASDMKTVDQVVHERMAQRPFISYEDFDVASFVDYGQLRYDKHENDPKRQGAGKGVGKKQ